MTTLLASRLSSLSTNQDRPAPVMAIGPIQLTVREPGSRDHSFRERAPTPDHYGVCVVTGGEKPTYAALLGFTAEGMRRPRRSIKCRKMSSGDRSFSVSDRPESASRMTSDRFACGHPSSRSASAIRSAAATSSGRRLAAMIR